MSVSATNATRRAILAGAAGTAFAWCAGGLAQRPASPIIAYDPHFLTLIDPRQSIAVVVEGQGLGTVPAGQEEDFGASLESPNWWEGENFLLFSDIPRNRIMKWSPGAGLSVFLEPSGHANGLWRDPAGRLLMAEHGGRQVSRIEPDGSRTVIMRSYRNQRLHRPNTVIVRSDGGIYFTDYGFRADPVEDWDLDFDGIYYVSPDLGTRRLLTRDVVEPHKILFSRDERTLLVGQRRGILAFDVGDIQRPNPAENQRGGRLVPESRRWFWQAGADPAEPAIIQTLVANRSTIVDGMKMDTEGNVWIGGREGVWAISAAGKLIGRIDTSGMGRGAPNLCFGGNDGRTLFIATNHSILSVRTRVRGVPIGPRRAGSAS